MNKLNEIYRRALFAKTIEAIINMLLREQVNLVEFKRKFKIRVDLRTDEQTKYRRIAQVLWTRGAMWRD